MLWHVRWKTVKLSSIMWHIVATNWTRNWTRREGRYHG